MNEQLEGSELNRAIADKLGYKLYEGNGRYGRFVVMQPPEHEYTADEWAKFWDMVEAYATPEEAYSSRWLPDWANDAGAALELCSEISVKKWAIQFAKELPKTYTAQFMFFHWENGYTTHYLGEGNTPALALARLALMELSKEPVKSQDTPSK